MTPTEPNEQARTTENEIQRSSPTQAAGDSSAPTIGEKDSQEKATKRRILIGSERDPAAYRARRKRDWAPVVEAESDQNAAGQPADSTENTVKDEKAPTQPPGGELEGGPRVIVPQAVLSEMLDEPAPLPALPTDTMPPAVPGSFPPPNVRQRLAPDQEAEFESAMGGESLDELLTSGDASATQEQLEADTKLAARIVAVRKDDVFVELGRREQGVLSMQQFIDPPVIGGIVDVIVQRFNAEDGLYELMLPGTAVHVEDWSDLSEGATVEAHVTGQNSGGLECEVNHIRGFIPISQVSMYRVEDLSEFVGQRFLCLVTEANPDRRNLVLSRRAILEREKAEAKQKLLESLKPGQIHEGVVRKLMGFGAFVDIGGVDGLLHVSQLAWGRVNHPSEVIAEGQKIKVRIEKINPETGKISFAYRDLLENPWSTAGQKFPPNSINKGRVVKIMDFGAFVELEPGLEGLIHISQLSYKRVVRCTDVVKEGQEVEVMVLSVDEKAQRISLSIKAYRSPSRPKRKKKRPSKRRPRRQPGTQSQRNRKKKFRLPAGWGNRPGRSSG